MEIYGMLVRRTSFCHFADMTMFRNLGGDEMKEGRSTERGRNVKGKR
jgi:hypothetical protein